MPELVRLGLKGGADFIIAVPKGSFGNARQQIDIFLAVHVPESRALASHDSQRVTAVGTAEQALFPGFHGGKGL